MSTPDLTAEELESCRIAFQKFDKDGSGSISDFELKAMLQCTRSEPAQLPALGRHAGWPNPARAHGVADVSCFARSHGSHGSGPLR